MKTAHLLPSQRHVLHPESTIVLARNCDECQGTGEIYYAYCRECSVQIPESDLRARRDMDSLMSCGHKWEELRECRTCFECGGSGVIQAAVPIRDVLQLATETTLHLMAEVAK